MNISYEKISLVIPCLNEQSFIEQCIRDILKQDFPVRQMEILFVDGGSTDKTRTLIKKFRKKHKQIHLLASKGDNASQAINVGIAAATTDVIVRLNAHCSYPSDYISELLFWLEKTKADNVGGSWHIRPRQATLRATAIAHVLGHPFGAGYSSYKSGFLKYEEEVDTVPFGCFPKSTFEKYGTFNESLNRNQDVELNKRIVRAGGLVLLVPDVFSTFYAPTGYFRLWKTNYENGKWAMRSKWIVQQNDLVSMRNYAPILFLLYLLIAVGISFFIPFTPFSIILFCPFLIYVFLIARASLSIALNKEKLELLPFLGMAFAVIHVAYGLGSCWGWLSGKLK